MRLWHKLFLIERSSIGLSFFRLAVTVTTGCYVFPTFVPLADNYLSTAYKTFNTNFFPVWFLQWVQQSPDALVIFFVILFCVSWFFFLVGLFSRISCVVMTACCYYFYALNHLAVGHALTWDILLVTLVLMCVTPYHGDYFSIDCLRRGDPEAYRRKRPFFLQRLLQVQIALTYFYTALYKVTAQGNWLTDNPIYYLMNYPPQGVTKNFLLKEPLSGHPELCYAIGVLIVGIELLMPFLLWCPKTRRSGIYLGFVFHITLILTLDVPAIFFFLFPPQLLLFINPDHIVRWIDEKRAANREAKKNLVVYDGHCGFCRASIRMLLIMDLFSVLKVVDYHRQEDLSVLHPQLTKQAAASRVYLVEPEGTLWGGFFAFRRLCLKLPMLYPLLPLVYFPGMDILGPLAYLWVAEHRYLFHLNRSCQDNACFRKD